MGLEVEVVGESNKFDVIVVGGGVAGMIASCAATQLGLKSCFLERDVPGGKLMQIESIHNLEINGMSAEEIPGPELAKQLLYQSTEQIKTTYVFGNVQYIKPRNNLFYLFTQDGQTWEAKALILCTGSINKLLNVKGESEYTNKGVSYCVLCDGAITKDKKVVLVGNPSHLSYLQQYASSVTVIKPGDVKEIIGDTRKVTGVVKNDETIVPCEYVFVENGYEYVTNFLPKQLQLSSTNEIIVDQNQATNIPGIYAAGDCTNSNIKMIKPAIEQAQIAAVNASEYIKNHKW